MPALPGIIHDQVCPIGAHEGRTRGQARDQEGAKKQAKNYQTDDYLKFILDTAC